MTQALVSLSGGMDSATVLGCAVDSKAEVFAVGFTYGSKHNKYENECAKQIADYYKVPFRLVNLSAVMGGFKSALMATGDPVPEGHFEAEYYVSNNSAEPQHDLLSILTGIAVSEKIDQIWLGVHAGDHHIYPDCRPEFISAMQKAIRVATDQNIQLITPFLQDTKREIILKGLSLTPIVPYKLTRTCYKCQPVACGVCGSCQERRCAFRELGLVDPIRYKSTVIFEKMQ